MTRRFSFVQMGAEIGAIRKAERNFERQRKLLARDGWTDDEIEELLAEYGETWATGMIEERAAKRMQRGHRLCLGSGKTVVGRQETAALPRVQCAECRYFLVVPLRPFLVVPVAPEHIWRAPKAWE